jgi:hypothetical protein
VDEYVFLGLGWWLKGVARALGDPRQRDQIMIRLD